MGNTGRPNSDPGLGYRMRFADRRLFLLSQHIQRWGSNLGWAYGGRVGPTMERFEKKDGNVVVVSDPYMVYEMAFLFDRDYFFLASGDDSLHRLLPLLKANGVKEYTYIFNPRNPASQPASLRDSTTRGLWTLAAEKKIREEFYCTKYTIE